MNGTRTAVTTLGSVPLLFVRPMKRYLALASIVLIGSVNAEVPPVMQAREAIAQHHLFYYPSPEYPYEARRDFITGSGVFGLRFDYETGHLREVHVITGTGSGYLDSAAIGVLKHWQAKPRSVRRLTIPITFSKR